MIKNFLMFISQNQLRKYYKLWEEKATKNWLLLKMSVTSWNENKANNKKDKYASKKKNLNWSLPTSTER